MKKLIYSLILLIFVAGVSGCMKQPTESEKKSSESAMLSYLKDKYEQDFTSIEYMAAKREFNDSMKENILIAKSEDGVQVNVRETLSKPGVFYDDYLNSFVSEKYNEKIDYSIENVHAAKTYLTLKPHMAEENRAIKEAASLTSADVIRVYTIISVSGEADAETLKGLYDVYQQVQALGFEKTVFIAAFSADKEKAETYVNNYFLYGSQTWEQYDESMKEILRVTDEGLSFEEFSKQVTVVGG